MSTLGSFVCVRNGFALDYSWELAAESLLKVCDQLILCDSDSTDGTREAMDRMADHDPRITVINWPWPDPKGESHHWFIEWLNFARQHLTTDCCLYLDADEVLSDAPECHTAIREAMGNNKCLAVDRLNFWRDASSLIPEGHCCGKWCVRFGPAKYECVSDEPRHKGERPIVDLAVQDGRVKIFHLGFLRKRDAFYRKARVVLGAWFNRFDPRLEKGEAAKKPVWETECEYTDKLTRFKGYMPDGVERWLSERGHNTEHYLSMNEQEAYKRVQVTTEMPGPGEPLNVLHIGDLGDILHCLPILKALGKTRLFLRDNNAICKRIIHRLPLIEPLLRSQSYITDVAQHKDEPIHWLASDFRKYHLDLTRPLLWSHMLHYRGQRNLPKLNVYPEKPWLTDIAPNPAGAGRIIINRTDRYNNRHFRWKEIVAHYGRALLFVGHSEEHLAFCEAFGPVDYQRTENLLKVAQLIAASLLFIGNQSACFAVAEGMKHLRLLEVCPWQPDVIVDAPGGSALYSADGTLDIPPLGRFPALQCPSAITNVNYLKNPNHQPQTGWKLNGYWDISYSTLKRQVMAKTRMTDKEAHKAIFDALAEREPSYFGGGEQTAEMKMFEQAIANAKQP